MGNLIDNLLNFSRISRQEISMELCNMNELVGRVVETQKLVYEKSQLNIHIKPLLPARCDGALIRHVWENLVSNAIKYTSKTPEPIIEIGTKDDKDQVIYYIKDNGAGFDMTYAGKLFGVFQRMHHQKDFEGTGVGLALANRIITRHGGKIWADAKVNEGAIFYFSLPK
jgi:light-regulated signal transduction histidine kinase (bacteriophytochrome)